MTVLKAVSLLIAFAALFMTFKAKLVAEKILKKEPDERLVLKIKYVALGLAVAAFIMIFI